MLGTAESRGAVLGPQPKDLLTALRIHPQHRSRQAVRTDDQVPHLKAADWPEARWREHGAGNRLCTATHERQRRHLDHAALEVAVDAIGVEHVEERVEEWPQVGIDLGLDVAG